MLLRHLAFDMAIEEAYRTRGQLGVDEYLETDTAEGLLNIFAVEWDIELHADPAAASSQLLIKPPGSDDLLPSWSIDAGRLHSRDLYRQAERTSSKPGNTGGLRQRMQAHSWLAGAIPTGAAGTPVKDGNQQKPKGPKPKGKAKPKA